MGNRKSRATTKPVLVDSLFGYQPARLGRLELLVIVHHWSCLPDSRHAISVTYVGDAAGPGKRKNATQMHTATSADKRFGLHIAQFLQRKIIVTDMVALGHYERLTGGHGACPECGHIGPIGAIYCGDLRPFGKPGTAPPPLGCGIRFAHTPARQAISA
jgi:hypothetical protein